MPSEYAEYAIRPLDDNRADDAWPARARAS